MTTPFISIIVPTYDRLESLAACVQAIGQLDYPLDRFELIIVDDGSPVPVEVPERVVRSDLSVTVLRQTNAGPALARNTGALHARGDILAFTDDDCLPATQWLKELAQAVRDAPTRLIGGRTMNGLVDNLYSTASQMIVDEAYGYFLSRDSDLRFFATNNMAVSATLFHAVGGFHPSFRTSEDREFCDRWIHGGHSLLYAPEAIVYHHHHLSLAGFFGQHFHYGRGAYLFHRVRARRGRSRVKPDLRFYALVCRHMLFSSLSWNSLRMAGLMGLWQLANLTGFFWQAMSRQSSSSIYMTLNSSQQTRSRGGEVWRSEDQKE
jgi:glycosyltransferase involved in cell wall biosynthesis